MVRCALTWSFQNEGSSVALFNSASRRVAVSTSKMPPQQSNGPPDVFDEALGFGAHLNSVAVQNGGFFKFA
jgi:hypothetical protein